MQLFSHCGACSRIEAGYFLIHTWIQFCSCSYTHEIAQVLHEIYFFFCIFHFPIKTRILSEYGDKCIKFSDRQPIKAILRQQLLGPRCAYHICISGILNLNLEYLNLTKKLSTTAFYNCKSYLSLYLVHILVPRVLNLREERRSLILFLICERLLITN